MNSIVSYVLSDLVASCIYVNPGWPFTLQLVGEFIPAVTLVPRFILSLRKLYERDLQGRSGTDFDTAFGLTSSSGLGVHASAIMFADNTLNHGLERGEEMVNLGGRVGNR